MIGLMWRFDRRPLPSQLADAVARHAERVGRAAVTLAVHPGELVAAEGLAVVEDRRVFAGYWLIGGEP